MRRVADPLLLGKLSALLSLGGHSTKPKGVCIPRRDKGRVHTTASLSHQIKKSILSPSNHLSLFTPTRLPLSDSFLCSFLASPAFVPVIGRRCSSLPFQASRGHFVV